MTHRIYRTPIEASPAQLFDWHARPDAFGRLNPPWMDVRIENGGGRITDNQTVELSIPMGIIRGKWVLRHRDYDPPRKFADQQITGPFRNWLHTHRMMPDLDGAPDRSVLSDEIDYALPFGPLGDLVAGKQIKRNLDQLFLWRHQRTQYDLRRHAKTRNEKPLRIVISGASGLVGTALRQFLTTGGHEVRTLVRRTPRESEIFWDPPVGKIDAAKLEGVDAVIHLAGENVAGGRWTVARKKRLEESRIGTTTLLSKTLAALDRVPTVLVSASAIGFYGNRGDEPLIETAPPGEGFLPDLCQQWEAASQPATNAGIRVVHPRIGVVLSAKGGALAKMLPSFKLGGGGVIGSGNQIISWIAHEDLIDIIHEAIVNPSLVGPVNATAPEPASNREFVHTLGEVLHRPTILPMPAKVVELVLGEMGRSLLLEGAKVTPAKLQAVNFTFRRPSLESALRAELGRQPVPFGFAMATQPT
jgi:uncharacterized protein (TIGR01777 family)